jgi:hypothetical protein
MLEAVTESRAPHRRWQTDVVIRGLVTFETRTAHQQLDHVVFDGAAAAEHQYGVDTPGLRSPATGHG